MKIDAAGAVSHQPGFGAACAGPDADQLVADAALALAWTIADIATSEGHRLRLLPGPAASGTGPAASPANAAARMSRGGQMLACRQALGPVTPELARLVGRGRGSGEALRAG
jgi:hypothetical protein